MIEVQHAVGGKTDLEMINELQDLLSHVVPDTTHYNPLHSKSAEDHRIENPFLMTARMVNALQAAKNVHYDNSYSKRGLASIFFNMERKWERLVAYVFSNRPDAASETFVDTVADMAAYSMKLLAWIAVRRPDLYLRLLKNIEAETRAAGLLAPDPDAVYSTMADAHVEAIPAHKALVQDDDEYTPPKPKPKPRPKIFDGSDGLSQE